MKRILCIALLFVNLQIVMTQGGLSLTFITASAQDMMFETLDEVVVESSKVQCMYCMRYYEPSEMPQHQSQCGAAPTTCTKCGQSVFRNELENNSHHCPGSENTNDNGSYGYPLGGSGGFSGGGNPGGSSGGGSSGGGSSGGGNTGGIGDSVVGSYHPDNNGTTSIGNPPFLPQEIHATVEGEVLFKKDLPAKTLTQRAKMDCVSTSLGIVYSLIGSDQTAEEVRSEIEKIYKRKTGEMLHAVGVRGSNNLNNLLEIPNLNFEKINPIDIVSSINDNMPIVAILDALNGSDKHMVVIVGYYDDWNTEAFQCINPGTGQYETHYSKEFYIKDIDGKNTITTYIYRKKY